MQVRNEIEKTAEGLLYDNYNQAHAIASLCPLLHGLCSHCWNVVQDVAVLLQYGPKFHWQRECDSHIGDVRKDGFQIPSANLASSQ